MTVKIGKFMKYLLAAAAVEIGIFISLYITLQEDHFLWLFVYALIKDLIIVIVFFLYRRAKENDVLSISRVLGSDAKNALVFGEVGIIIYDEALNITWASDLFTEQNMDLIGKRLDLWKPSLMKTFDNDEIIDIEIDGQTYDVFNNMETNCIYFKNVTLYKKAYNLYLREKPVIGFINIDNYEESVTNADDHTAALIQASVRQTISDWGKENGIILRRYRSDSYVVIMTEEKYDRILQGKFSLLNKVKEEAKELDSLLTISMGIGRNCQDLRELEELATSSLTLALSRGGDQVVVKAEGEAVRFYGGNSEAYEKNNRVRSRIIAKSLSGLIKGSSNVVIMGHQESDFDSLGASVGMFRFVQGYDKPVNIVIDLDSIEEKTRLGIDELLSEETYKDIFITTAKAEDITKTSTLVILVDHHRPSMTIAKNVLKQTKNIVVVDHHRRGEEFCENTILTYLEPVASSTVELVIELLGYHDIKMKLSEKEATIMYTGMLVDTNYFKNKVGVRTFNSASVLKSKNANIKKAYEYLEEGYDYIVTQAKIMQTVERVTDDIVVAYAPKDVKVTRAVLSKVANEIVEISEMEAAFLLGEVESNTIAISARSKGNINIQIMMEELGGGGHFTAAGTQIEGKPLEECIEIVKNLVAKHLKDGE